MQHSPYYSPEALTNAVTKGRHREAIGGLWEEMGKLQLEFLKSQGMQPQHRLLDIGCGSLRLGCKAVDYLEPGHYFGLDLSEELIEAGYQKELSETQRHRLPRKNLQAESSFDFSFLTRQACADIANPSKCEARSGGGSEAVGVKTPIQIDYAMAQSVFTHLPFNHIRRCLAMLAPHLTEGGVFFATAWLIPDSHPLHQPFTQPGAIDGIPIVTTDLADPYHYRAADFAHAVMDMPYRFELVGEWGHPRGQPILVFRRV